MKTRKTKPVKFKGANTDFATNQDEYGNLPAMVIGQGDTFHIISGWKVPFFQRFVLLWTGRIWQDLLSAQPNVTTPSSISVIRKHIFLTSKQAKKLKPKVDAMQDKVKTININKDNKNAEDSEEIYSDQD